MITLKDLYNVMTAVVPLYTTMLLAYASVRWWRLFTPEQCAGINRFVAVFAVPLLSFEFISRIDPSRLQLPFLAADGASKTLALAAALAWARFARRGNLDWAITAFSLASLPNSLVMGIPLLKSMYGDDQEGLMVQVVVLQCVVWYTLLLFLFEYREARGIAMRAAAESGDADRPARAPEEEAGIVIGVVVARPSPSPEPDQQQTRGQVLISKVVPDSGQPVKAEEAAGRDLHILVWKCCCCIPQGGRFCGRQTPQAAACRKENIAVEEGEEEEKPSEGSTTSSTKMVKTILTMVWWKLVKNPNSYASLLGLTWALASCRWSMKKPQIMENSVAILANAGLGMAMFSLGLFMAMQPRVVACGYRLAAHGMALRFLASPLVMGVASLGFGLRGKTLKLSIVQVMISVDRLHLHPGHSPIEPIIFIF